MLTHEKNGLTWFTSEGIPVPHAFSSRLGGVSQAPFDSLDLSPAHMAEHPEETLENFRRFYGVIGADIAQAVLSNQVHEDTVRPVTAADAGKGLFRNRDYTADALITAVPDMTLTVFSADCTNLLLWDSRTGAVGAVHAGWRGCAAGIVEKTVREMNRLYSTLPEDLFAAIGPCIAKCCFETGEDVPTAMLDALGADAALYMERSGDKWHVDLPGLNELWLLRSGLAPDRIEVSGLCTACRPDLFWSHRKMGWARGLQAAAITCIK